MTACRVRCADPWSTTQRAAYAARRLSYRIDLEVHVMEGKLRTEDGTVVCERCTLARSPLARMRGLLGRRSLDEGEGLLLQPAGSIHTWFMRFPIDAVFLDRDQRVVKVAGGVRPWRAAAAKRSRSVLELGAGEAARVGVVAGDVLQLEVS